MPTEPLTEEQQEIRELIRELARERIAPRAAAIDKSAEFPWDVVEVFREHGIFGVLYDEEYGGLGASCADGARGDRGGLQGLCDQRPDHRRPGARHARPQAGRNGRAEAAVPAQARLRRVACGLRAHRARLGLRLRSHAQRGAARRRRVRHQRLEALHHERRRRRPLHRLRQDRAGRGPLRDLGVRRRGVQPGLRGRPDRAEDGHQGLDDRRDLLQRHADPGGQPPRRGGRGLQDRDAHPRPLPARDRRPGARARAGGDRLRARVRARTARRWASRSRSTS